MKFKHALLTDVGNYRKSNQDYLDFCTNKEGAAFGIVCDGMGGHAHGEVASKIAVTKFIEYFKKQSFTKLDQKAINKWLRTGINKIFEFMQDYAEDYPKTLDMGTTLTAILFVNEVAYVINVGDSRTYKVVNNNLFQVTQDQNLWNATDDDERRDIQSSGIYGDRANDLTFWKVLTSALGPKKTLKIDTYFIEKAAGTYILTTDGIHDYIDNEITAATLINNTVALKDKCRTIIEDAKENMSTDNLSILLIEAE